MADASHRVLTGGVVAVAGEGSAKEAPARFARDERGKVPRSAEIRVGGLMRHGGAETLTLGLLLTQQ